MDIGYGMATPAWSSCDGVLVSLKCVLAGELLLVTTGGGAG
jgi:hypothetical protein